MRSNFDANDTSFRSRSGLALYYTSFRVNAVYKKTGKSLTFFSIMTTVRRRIQDLTPTGTNCHQRRLKCLFPSRSPFERPGSLRWVGQSNSSRGKTNILVKKIHQPQTCAKFLTKSPQFRTLDLIPECQEETKRGISIFRALVLRF